MILCDYKIKEAIEKGELVVTPAPVASQYDSTALNLRVGDDFRKWREALKAPGFDGSIDLDHVHLSELLPLTEPVEVVNGIVTIAPGDFVLVRSLERVSFPLKSKLAARVEGRSTLARLGFSVHITAPTIHAGFDGRITLEILNHGPFAIKLRPNQSEICQLIIECVKGIPKRQVQTRFLGQSTPLGTPKGKTPRK
ncbi:MAG: dCTP deaminase [Pirellulales bacterium]